MESVIFSSPMVIIVSVLAVIMIIAARFTANHTVGSVLYLLSFLFVIGCVIYLFLLGVNLYELLAYVMIFALLGLTAFFTVKDKYVSEDGNEEANANHIIDNIELEETEDK